MPVAKKQTIRNIYRTVVFGVVVRRGKELDDTPLAKGTLIDPTSVDEDHIALLIGRGLVEKIQVGLEAETPRPPTQRDAEVAPPVILPTSL